MTATARTEERGITSSMARCVRQAAYRALGHEPAEPPYAVREYLRRGQVCERLRAAEYDAAYGADRVQRHRRVSWHAGGVDFNGEIDIYLPDERCVVEIVSAVSPSPLTLGHKIEQARQYVVLDPDADKALVDVIDPSRLVPADSLPVTVTAEHEREVRERVGQVDEALRSGGERMPPRVCGKPSDAGKYYCPFAHVCFDGWEAPELSLDGPEALAAAERLHTAKRALAQAKLAADAADVVWRESQAAAAELIPPGKTQVGGYDVTRTQVPGRTTFRYSVAVKAGAIDPAAAADFVRVSEPYERWDVKLDDDDGYDDGEVLP